MAKLKFLSTLYKVLQPALAILVLFAILEVSLFVYDRTATLKEEALGDRMTKNFSVTADCNRLIIPGEAAELKFEFQNKNSEDLALKTVGIDVNLTGVSGKIFTKLSKTDPIYKKIENKEKQYTTAHFEDTFVKANSKKEVKVVLTGATRQEAGGNPETITGYTGDILFTFDHDIKTKPSCTVQVRYAK